jgi:hypothetical protein
MKRFRDTWAYGGTALQKRNSVLYWKISISVIVVEGDNISTFKGHKQIFPALQKRLLVFPGYALC